VEAGDKPEEMSRGESTGGGEACRLRDVDSGVGIGPAVGSVFTASFKAVADREVGLIGRAAGLGSSAAIKISCQPCSVFLKRGVLLARCRRLSRHADEPQVNGKVMHQKTRVLRAWCTARGLLERHQPCLARPTRSPTDMLRLKVWIFALHEGFGWSLLSAPLE
jgi:hypothetical protein